MNEDARTITHNEPFKDSLSANVADKPLFS